MPQSKDCVGDPTTTVVVTVWKHGTHVVGRVTPVEGVASRPPAPGKPCRSVDDICAEVRALVESVGRT
ncbi:MAG TPA: hypothetical protein VGO92_05975 [Acidimicrobiales bacterium]|nr:hypothetical protein [Acidimicrobiales bacterium]